MPTGNRGAIHLFRLAGVDLYLHWSWFLVAFYEIQRGGRYTSLVWSIAAGPLVNVALMPVLYGAVVLGQSLGWAESMPNALAFVRAVLWIDVILLVFNILPIYPLDGGQILRSLLWFVLGRARSLMVATILGFIGVAGFIGLAVWRQDVWLGAIAVFMLMNC